MDMVDVIDVMREGVIVLLKMSGPVMAVALIVGLAVSLFQALTQMQEMTLTFVPKIVAIFLALLLFLPFMLTTLIEFTQTLADRIVSMG